MTNHPNRGRLTALLRRRIASAYPVAAPFDNRDVVICFPTPEDADAFSKELAFEPEGQTTWKVGDPRCADCDNGLERTWLYCPYCGCQRDPEKPRPIFGEC